ncbi:MAG TPA: thiamine pyrophosphate-binding protein, partial [Steroidobacteraceae bacterium]
MARKELKAESVAEAYLALLAERGVEYLFANAGTDFAPIVEAYAKAAHTGFPAPKPLIATHENLALSMAHGYAVASGKVPAVMVHVSVGTANALCGVFNAARANVPILFTAGRSPLTEEGLAGARDTYIHWAQEMFDQAGMVREIVKWDYELRVPEQVADVVARAHEVAMSSPRGPVYLVLPREPLSAALDEMPLIAPRQVAAPAYPDPAAIEQLAGWIAQAERPLIITAGAGTDERAVAALAQLAERAAIAVVSHNPRSLALPFSHPMHAGFDSGPLVGEADLIIVIESDAPWYPSMQTPATGCRVAHIGEDPAFVRYPMRSFPSDLAIAAMPATVLAALDAALAKKKLDVDGRRAKLAE